MASLTRSARTILRSRLRRHADALLIAQHINGAYAAANISDLRAPALLETAARFGCAIPTQAECDAYQRTLDAGRGSSEAMAAADTAAPANSLARVGLVNVQNPGAVAAGFSASQDTVDPDGDDDAPIEVLQAIPDAAPAPAPSQEDEERALVDAEVKRIMRLSGEGDFAGYTLALAETVRAARKPAQVIMQAPVDVSKIVGHVPVRTGQKTMAEAGIVAALNGVKPDKATLATYDTPDAPMIDKAYSWPMFTSVVLANMRRGANVFFTGPAGTGKTSFAQQVAARFGRRFVRISCDDQTDAQTLVGMTVPAAGGGVKWQDGQLAAAIRVPGTIVLVDEPTVARPGALFVLQAIMDDDRKLHIAETGEVVHVAPDVCIVLADNTNGTGDLTGQYEATRRMNRATLDRLAITVRFEYMTATEESQILAAKTGCPKKVAAVLARFGALTRARAEEGKISHPVGLRRLLALAANIVDGVDPALAYQMAVVAGAPFDDHEPLRQFFTADMDLKSLSEAMGRAS